MDFQMNLSSVYVILISVSGSIYALTLTFYLGSH